MMDFTRIQGYFVVIAGFPGALYFVWVTAIHIKYKRPKKAILTALFTVIPLSSATMALLSLSGYHVDLLWLGVPALSLYLITVVNDKWK